MPAHCSGRLLVSLLFVALLAAVPVALLRAAPATQPADSKETRPVPPVLQFTMPSLEGQPVDLSRYQGKVLLVVNTASKCGHTPQYAQLQQLHDRYQDKGLVVLGFPANDFKNQEPGTDADIKSFCEQNYGVSFPMFSKIHVVGPEKAPLYQYLTSESSNPKFPGEVKWNFEKFLISRDGEVVGRFRSGIKPLSDEVVTAIEAELAR